MVQVRRARDHFLERMLGGGSAPGAGSGESLLHQRRRGSRQVWAGAIAWTGPVHWPELRCDGGRHDDFSGSHQHRRELLAQGHPGRNLSFELRHSGPHRLSVRVCAGQSLSPGWLGGGAWIISRSYLADDDRALERHPSGPARRLWIRHSHRVSAVDHALLSELRDFRWAAAHRSHYRNERARVGERGPLSCRAVAQVHACRPPGAVPESRTGNDAVVADRCHPEGSEDLLSVILRDSRKPLFRNATD